MNQEEYGSDTSDEDFVPSANESSGEEEDGGQEGGGQGIREGGGGGGGGGKDEEEEEEGAARSKRKKQPKTKKPEPKKRKTLQLSDEEDGPAKKEKGLSSTPEATLSAHPIPSATATPSPSVNPPLQAEAPQPPTMSAEELEKKKKLESLWAQMNSKPLSRTPASPKPPAPASPASASPASISSPSPSPLSKPVAPASPLAHLFAKKPEDKEKVVVTKTYKFAGKDVEIQETVDRKGLEAKKKTATTSSLDQLLAKKQKINVLDKSHHDWNAYVDKTGMGDDLERNKKDGYLDKVSFLERSDERQAQYEREMRRGARS